MIDTILLTGATGYAGKALIPFLISKYNPRSIRLFARNDWKMAQLLRSLGDLYKYQFLRPLIGDVCDRERVFSVVDGCDLVVHMAAIKRVEIANYNPQEAVKVNVIGSMNVMDACIQKKVNKAIFIGSDKGVHPQNLYGYTKGLMVSMVHERAKELGISSPTMVSTVWGNVVGSTGAVVPYFIERAKQRLSIPITHKDMTRFIVTRKDIKDTIGRAIEDGKQGEILVPKKLRAISILTAADVIVKHFDSTSPIEVIGAWSGEKLHEELPGGIFSNDASYQLGRDEFLDVLREEELI